MPVINILILNIKKVTTNILILNKKKSNNKYINFKYKKGKLLSLFLFLIIHKITTNPPNCPPFRAFFAKIRGGGTVLLAPFPFFL